MRVISKARLKQFWEQPRHGEAQGPLRAWHTHVNNRAVAWQSWGDVKAEFATASIVGDCIVFNVGGNKFRLIVRIRYATQKVFVLKVMTHAEYDDEKWKKDCGCFAKPPKPAAKKPRPVQRRPFPRKGRS